MHPRPPADALPTPGVSRPRGRAAEPGGARPVSGRISRRLAKITMVAALLLGLLMSGVQVVFDYRRHSQAHAGTLEQVLDVAARTARKAAYEIDPALAVEVIQSLLVYDFIVAAALESDLGDVLARSAPATDPSAQRSWIERLLVADALSVREVDLRDPREPGRTIGMLQVTVDRLEVLRPFLARATLTVTAGVLRNLVLAALLLYLFNALLTRRLMDLVQRFAPAAPAPPPAAAAGRAAARDELDALSQVLDTFVDRSDRALQAEASARDRAQAGQRRIEAVLTAMPDPVIVTDDGARVRFANAEAVALCGRPAPAIIGRRLGAVLELRAGPSGRDLSASLEQQITSGAVTTGRGEARLETSPPIELSYAIALLPVDAEDARRGAVLILRDVTERLRLSRELAHRAAHDRLTGLLNREEFESRLDALVARARDGDGEHALCYLDLDQFKVVNDTVGHAAGDQLLVEVSRTLRRMMRAHDTLARIGGDEFAILLENCTVGGARRVADSIVELVQATAFRWQDEEFRVGASIGLVPVNGSTVDRAEVMSRADVACYMAKERGRNCVAVSEDGDTALPQRMDELNRVPQIRRALAEDRFKLLLQPIVALRETQPATAWYEVLVRFEDDAKQLMPPAAFIASAERYGLMADVDRRVVERAAALSHELSRCTASHALSVNLSGQSLSEGGFVTFVRDTLRAHAADPRSFCFEVTETAAVRDIERAAVAIEELRALGCRFALDDFGSGLSSFGYLKSLPIDVLKVDGSFVRDMVDDSGDQAMVAAIHGVGAALGIETVAEWVEDARTARALRDLGVDYAQGWHFGRPQPCEAVLAAARSAHAAQARRA